MKIPQVKPWLDEAEVAALAEVTRSGWITEGPKTAEFGRRLNELIGVQYGVFAPNGTLALYLGLVALGIGTGDEVIVPDITFAASAFAVIMAGAIPVFVDVDLDTYQMTAELTEPALTPQTRAIMPVHLYGQSPNMSELIDLAGRRDLLVIEDAAEAIGVKFCGKHAGSFGDAGCFSFFADKTITTGEGGYVVCRDREVYEQLQYLRNQGRQSSGAFIHPSIGYNFRITDWQAAVGLVQMDKLPQIIRRKRIILEWYHEELKDVDEVSLLKIEPGSDFIPFRVVVFVDRLYDLMASLKAAGVQTRNFFYPLHRQPKMTQSGDFPAADYGWEHGLCLPVYPELRKEEVAYVCKRIKEFYVPARIL